MTAQWRCRCSSAGREKEEGETGGEKGDDTEESEEVVASGYDTPVVATPPDEEDGLSDAARPQLVDDVIARAQSVLEAAATRTEG